MKISSLTKLAAEFPNLATRIQIQHADANSAVEAFCADTNWRRTRAIMFLDPFGNQVGWKTLETIARTKAIDLWYLFPAGQGVNRQISSTGELDAHKAASLDFMLGCSDWRKEFISTVETRDLFGMHQENSLKQANVDSITRFMIKRMKGIFGGLVLDEWLPLGRSGSHWYSLLFACSNPSGKATGIAKRVASAVMKRK